MSNLLQKREGIEGVKCDLRLVHGGSDLNPNATMASYGIDKGATVSIMYSLHACASLASPPAADDPTPPSSFQVFVVLPSGRYVTADLRSSDTILSLKASIEAKSGIAVRDQLLVRSGRVLHDKFTVSEHGLSSRSTVFLFLRLLGGGVGSFVFEAFGKVDTRKMETLSEVVKKTLFNPNSKAKLTVGIDGNAVIFDLLQKHYFQLLTGCSKLTGFGDEVLRYVKSVEEANLHVMFFADPLRNRRPDHKKTVAKERQAECEKNHTLFLDALRRGNKKDSKRFGKRCTFVSDQILLRVLQHLKSKGVDCRIADNCEADECMQLAFSTKEIDLVMSNDADFLVLGIPTIRQYNMYSRTCFPVPSLQCYFECQTHFLYGISCLELQIASAATCCDDLGTCISAESAKVKGFALKSGLKFITEIRREHRHLDEGLRGCIEATLAADERRAVIHETLELLLDKMLQRYIIPEGHMTRDQRLKVMKGAIDRMAALRSLRGAQKVEESLFDPINNGDMFDYNTGESKVDMLLEFWDHKEGPPVTAPSIDGIGWKRIEMERRRVARETRGEELSLKEAATSGAIPRVAQPIVDAQMSELTSSTDPTNSASDDERKKNRAIELYFLEGKSREVRRERGRSISLAQRGRLTFVAEAGVREAYKADIIRTRSARGVESLDAESWYAVFDEYYDLHQ